MSNLSNLIWALQNTRSAGEMTAVEFARAEAKVAQETKLQSSLVVGASAGLGSLTTAWFVVSFGIEPSAVLKAAGAATGAVVGMWVASICRRPRLRSMIDGT